MSYKKLPQKSFKISMANGLTLTSVNNDNEKELEKVDEDHQDQELSCALDLDKKLPPNSRRHSISSTKSWSSGKNYKAPQPPLKAKLKLWWTKDSNKRQCYLWLSFTCLILAIIIAMIIILQRFLKGSEKYSREEIDENYLFGATNGQKLKPYDKWQQKVREDKTSNGNVVLIVGGQNSTQVELFSGSEHCKGAHLPSTRIGHAVASNSKGKVFMCGGFSPGSNSFQIRLQNKECFMLDMLRNNQWKSLPNLPQGVSYATANFLEGQLMVLGGFRERQKVSYIQIFDHVNMKWKIAPFSYPNGIWGHCVAMTKDGDLYSTGGWSDPDPQASLKSNLVLSANGKREWSDRNSMNVGRGTHACLATHYKNEESAIIVAGGLNFADRPLKSVEIFLASQNKWFPMGSLQSPRSWYPSLFILNNRLTCIGGKKGESSLEVYRSRLGKWEQKRASFNFKHDARATLVLTEIFKGCHE